MDAKVIKAYDCLVPADQLVIDAMLLTLHNKDKEIRNLVMEITKMLEEKEQS